MAHNKYLVYEGKKNKFLSGIINCDKIVTFVLILVPFKSQEI